MFPHKLYRMLSIVNSGRQHGFVLQRNGVARWTTTTSLCRYSPTRCSRRWAPSICVRNLNAQSHQDAGHDRGSEYNCVESMLLLWLCYERRAGDTNGSLLWDGAVLLREKVPLRSIVRENRRKAITMLVDNMTTVCRRRAAPCRAAEYYCYRSAAAAMQRRRV